MIPKEHRRLFVAVTTLMGLGLTWAQLELPSGTDLAGDNWLAFLLLGVALTSYITNYLRRRRAKPLTQSAAILPPAVPAVMIGLFVFVRIVGTPDMSVGQALFLVIAAGVALLQLAMGSGISKHLPERGEEHKERRGGERF